MIPGVSTELPLRAKVRTGKKVGKNPRSVDEFLCDDPTWRRLLGDGPVRTVRVRLPYNTVEEVFPGGLERWVKAKNSNILSCYTKGDGVAHRLGKVRAPNGDIRMDPTVGSKRGEMKCRHRECEYFGKGEGKGCGPKARFNFFLADDVDPVEVYRWETQSLNSYGPMVAVLKAAGDLLGKTFLLTVEWKRDGENRFPLVSLVPDPAAPQPAAAEGESQPRPPEPGSSPSSSTPPPGDAASTSGSASTGTGDGEPPVDFAGDVDPKFIVAELLHSLKQKPSRDIDEWVARVGYDEAIRLLEERVARRD